MTLGRDHFPVGISGLGMYVPPKIITNHDFVMMGLDTSDEWIVSRTGIRERRVVEGDVSTSDLAFLAAQDAMRDSGVDPSHIDGIIVATSTPDHALFPSTACLIQDRLKLPVTTAAFDMSAACTGFNYALSTAFRFVASGAMRHVLVISADVLSRHLDWTDRGTCILFGDGAGAVMVSQVPNGYGEISSRLYSDGSYADILGVKKGEACISMEGRAVFKVAVNTIVPAVGDILSEAGFSGDDLDVLVMHQANQRILEAARERLGISQDKVMMTLDRYGNTSSSSIPIALCEARKQGKLKSGDLVLLAGFGAGFTWGVNLLRWV
jgi:3-oxoacyl-[acyl-carrier-protein] synthase-3